MTTHPTASRDELVALLKQLHDGVDGYLLSWQGRSRHGNSSNFIYGEVTPEAVEQMLALVMVQPGDVFVDLGCGTGKALFYAAALTPISRGVGIELLDELVTAARAANERFEAEIRPRLAPSAARIDVIHGDLFEQDLSGADIVFGHCTCFSPTLLAGFVARCATLKPGARLITVSNVIEADHLQPLASQPVKMAWGKGVLHTYRRT